MFFLPEVLKLDGGNIGNLGGRTWLPAGGTDFTVLVRVLEASNQAEHLFSIATDWEVTDRLVSKDPLSVYDVSGTEGATSIRPLIHVAAVRLGDALGDVRQHGYLNSTDTSLLFR